MKKEILQPIKEDKVFESEQSSSKTVVKRTKSFTVLNKPATIDKRASIMSTNKIIKNVALVDSSFDSTHCYSIDTTLACVCDSIRL